MVVIQNLLILTEVLDHPFCSPGKFKGDILNRLISWVFQHLNEGIPFSFKVFS